jgi:hypothetical protein
VEQPLQKTAALTVYIHQQPYTRSAMDKKLSVLPVFLPLIAGATLVYGQETTATAAPSIEVKPGSTAFCLYELPSNEDGKRRWVNLGIVQYVEFSRNELKVYYGGGNLGSGHEAKFPISSTAQLEETLNKIKQTAANCR